MLNIISKKNMEEVLKDINNYLNDVLIGSFSIILLIKNYGLVAIRDKFGVRPLVYGELNNNYLISSETVSLDALNYDKIDDIKAGEMLIFKKNEKVIKYNVNQKCNYTPCIFEYIYFARPDSIVDNILVHDARISMGRFLGKKLKKMDLINDIDYVTYIPYTARTSALGVAMEINKDFKEVIVRNRYIDRTFIMPTQKLRKLSINRKLNIIRSLVKGKNILLIDDSIVRGNTSKNIIKRLRNCGAKKIVFGSVSPIVKFPNIYGIDIATKKELLSYNKNLEDMRKILDVDNLVYQSLEDITKSIIKFNKKLKGFESSVFTGKYLLNNMDKYLKDYYRQSK